MLHRFDLQRDEAQAKFDMDQDDAQRRFMAALWGVKLQANCSQTRQPSPTSGQKKTMTAQDIMRNYGK